MVDPWVHCIKPGSSAAPRTVSEIGVGKAGEGNQQRYITDYRITRYQ